MPHSDPILEAFLTESFGDQSPPDLKDRILSALAEKSSKSNGVTNEYAEASLALNEPEPPPVQVSSAIDQAKQTTSAANAKSAPQPRSLTEQRRPSDWLYQAGVFTAVVLVCGLFSLSAVYFAVIKNNDAITAENGGVDPDSSDPANVPSQPNQTPGNLVAEADSTEVGGSGVDPKPNGPRKRPRKDGGTIVSVPPKQPTSPVEKITKPYVVANTLPAKPTSDHDVVAAINSAVVGSWKEQNITPSEQASDEQWVGRAYRKIVGREPTANEHRAFLKTEGSQRREKLVDRLIESPEFAKHWSTLLANDLLGAERTSAGRREGLRVYLEESLRENKPYNQVAYELLAAEGSSDSSVDDYNPALHFLATTGDNKALNTTSHVARGLLAKNLACAQCHDDSIASAPQQEFWGLNAFFRQMKSERADGGWRLTNTDFSGEGNNSNDAEIYFETPSGELQVAYPAFAGVEIDHSGNVDQVNRRHELGKLVAHSPDLSKAIVNRVWAKLHGYGFTNPVDDIGPHNPPSHPELLNELAGEFEARDYRIADLVGWLALSKPFGLATETSPTTLAVDAPELGSQPLFSRYYSRSQSAPSVGDSLQVALRAHKSTGFNGEANRSDWVGDFARVVGDGEASNGLMRQIMDQPLIASNDYLLQNSVSPHQQKLIARIAASKLSPNEKIDHLFLAGIGRKPTKTERTLASDILNDRADSPQALQAIWWALLNGK